MCVESDSVERHNTFILCMSFKCSTIADKNCKKKHSTKLIPALHCVMVYTRNVLFYFSEIYIFRKKRVENVLVYLILTFPNKSLWDSTIDDVTVILQTCVCIFFPDISLW